VAILHTRRQRKLALEALRGFSGSKITSESGVDQLQSENRPTYNSAPLGSRASSNSSIFQP